MRGGLGCAACVMGLCLAGPAGAQGYSAGAAGHNPALTGIGRAAPVRQAPLEPRGPLISFSNDTIIRQDGMPGDRRSIVGSLPLVGSVAAEVGLFSVAAAVVKEREPKRTDPMADVQPRRSRVAAVGLRMNF